MSAPGATCGRVSPIHVLVGILRDHRGRVLIAQRPGDKHMAGAWEFPGGKRKPGEDRLTALRREIAEEIDVEIVAAEPFLALAHDYPDRSVLLDVWWVREYRRAARACEGQRLRWIEVEALMHAALLDADRPIVAAIRDRLAGNLSE